MTNPPDPKTKTPRTDKCLSQYDDFGQYRSEPRRLELLAIESSTLELENQSLTRRLEEAVNEVGALKAQLGDLGFRSAELLDDCEAKDAKLTALRTVAEGARDALADMIRGAQKQNWQDNYPQEINAAYKALAALRAELDQADSNASNSPTASRESQG